MDIVVNWLKGHSKLVMGLVAGLAALSVTWGVVSWINSIDNEGFEKQRGVLQQYNVYQTELSTCLDNTSISSQVAAEEYRQLKDILTSVISARYVGPDGEPTNAGGALGGGQLISALEERYPEIDNSLWKQVLTTAVGCRNQVAGVNNELQSVAARFDNWVNTGGPIEKQFRKRYPTDELKIMGINGELTGQEALDFLTTPILTGSAREAIRNQQMPDQELFPGGDPSSSE